MQVRSVPIIGSTGRTVTPARFATSRPSDCRCRTSRSLCAQGWRLFHVAKLQADSGLPFGTAGGRAGLRTVTIERQPNERQRAGVGWDRHGFAIGIGIRSANTGHAADGATGQRRRDQSRHERVRRRIFGKFPEPQRQFVLGQSQPHERHVGNVQPGRHVRHVGHGHHGHVGHGRQRPRRNEWQPGHDRQPAIRQSVELDRSQRQQRTAA